MPCHDSSGSVYIKLDGDNRLIDFQYTKITCGRTVGGNTGLKQFCHGKSIDELLELDYGQLAAELNLDNEDDQFLLYLEYEALITALLQYSGSEIALEKDRYKIAAITYLGDAVEIKQTIYPSKEMPKILPCSAYLGKR
jgi:NifU-like protein involved in Fe-S cluster formation